MVDCKKRQPLGREYNVALDKTAVDDVLADIGRDGVFECCVDPVGIEIEELSCAAGRASECFNRLWGRSRDE